MNWKIIFQLSVFGMIMAVATISLIPEKIEPAFWLVIFLFCAWVIAKVCSGKYFLHGFLVSMVNCVWIVIAHTLFYATYVAHHMDMLAMNKSFPASMQTHPRTIMVITGPFFGVAFGLMLGLFSFIASKILKKKAA